jgi:hypothetical protein
MDVLIQRPRAWLAPFAGAGRFAYVPSTVLVIFGCAWLIEVTVLTLSKGMFDFHTFYLAGQAVLDGASPYPRNVHDVIKQDHLVYPAPAGLLFAPFSLLPWTVASVVWYALCVGWALGALWVVGVRDSRVYFASMASLWFGHALFLGALTPLLAFGAALAWRWRDHWWRCACALAAVISVKVFPAPLIVWLWSAGRRRAALASALATAVIVLAAWAALGFNGLTSYPSVLRMLSQVFADQGVSMNAALQHAGLSLSSATHVCWAIAAGVAGTAIWLGRRDERHAFLLCIVAALIASPIVWTNYMMLLMVAVATYRPRLGWVWLLPLTLWLVPDVNVEGSVARPIVWNLIVLVIAADCLWAGDRPAPATV